MIKVTINNLNSLYKAFSARHAPCPRGEEGTFQPKCTNSPTKSLDLFRIDILLLISMTKINGNPAYP